MIWHGASYPHPSTTLDTPQSLNLTLFCTTESSDPKFIDYDGAQLRVEWSVKQACGFQGDQPPGGDEDEGKSKKKSVGSGIGFFFIVCVLLSIP